MYFCLVSASRGGETLLFKLSVCLRLVYMNLFISLEAVPLPLFGIPTSLLGPSSSWHSCMLYNTKDNQQLRLGGLPLGPNSSQENSTACEL